MCTTATDTIPVGYAYDAYRAAAGSPYYWINRAAEGIIAPLYSIHEVTDDGREVTIAYCVFLRHAVEIVDALRVYGVERHG